MSQQCCWGPGCRSEHRKSEAGMRERDCGSLKSPNHSHLTSRLICEHCWGHWWGSSPGWEKVIHQLAILAVHCVKQGQEPPRSSWYRFSGERWISARRKEDIIPWTVVLHRCYDHRGKWTWFPFLPKNENMMNTSEMGICFHRILLF